MRGGQRPSLLGALATAKAKAGLYSSSSPIRGMKASTHSWGAFDARNTPALAKRGPLDKKFFLYTIRLKRIFCFMRSHPTIDHICSELRQEIVNRLIPPGAKLSESLLSKRWKVSRTPIREVLRRLEAEGLVSSSRYRGFVVNSISIEDIEQIYTIKMSLEGLAGRLAAPILLRDPEKLKKLQRLWKQMSALWKKGDVEGYGKRNIEFHLTIWYECGNPWLIRILDHLSSQLNRFIVNALHVPGRMERSVKEHQKIVEAFEAGNAKAVEKALAYHFKRASEDLKKEILRMS